MSLSYHTFTSVSSVKTKGKGKQKGKDSSEYQVKTGLVLREIQIVLDKVIHCSVSESLSTSERQMSVMIQVGKFNCTTAATDHQQISSEQITTAGGYSRKGFISCQVFTLVTSHE